MVSKNGSVGLENKSVKKVKSKRNSYLKKAALARVEFKREFNSQLLAAITAAFAFLIALSWREPISELLNLLLEPLGARETILIKFVGALIITLIAALVLLVLTKRLKQDDSLVDEKVVDKKAKK
ncbi:MAG: DUF5654 family protein [Candidatus Woesearchaeota archaeon]